MYRANTNMPFQFSFTVQRISSLPFFHRMTASQIRAGRCIANNVVLTCNLLGNYQVIKYSGRCFLTFKTF